MLKTCGMIVWLLGVGGLIYAASTRGEGVATPTGPDWVYSRY